MELFDVLDEKGEKTGEVKSRADVHRDGDWHRAVHIWFINSKGELLLQLRSKIKESHAGQWDATVGGHLSAGQNSIEGVVREAKEEIGIDLNPADLKLVGTVKSESTLKNGTYINKEFQDVYIARKDIDIETLILQPEEVEAMKYVSPQEFKQMITSNDPQLVSHPEEYKLLISYFGL